MTLWKSNRDQDFDLLEIEGDNIQAVWKELPAKVARYWDAPHMPALTWVPAEHTRQVMGVR